MLVPPLIFISFVVSPIIMMMIWTRHDRKVWNDGIDAKSGKPWQASEYNEGVKIWTDDPSKYRLLKSLNLEELEN